jgi:hypothetical protein
MRKQLKKSLVHSVLRIVPHITVHPNTREHAHAILYAAQAVF